MNENQISLENTYKALENTDQTEVPADAPEIDFAEYIADESRPLADRLAIVLLVVFKIAIANRISLYHLTETAFIRSRSNVAFINVVLPTGADEEAEVPTEVPSGEASTESKADATETEVPSEQ